MNIFFVSLRLINGIIEYDQKLTSLPTYLKAQQRQFSKHYWNKIFICTSLYYIVFTFMYMYLWPIKIMDITLIIVFFIRVSFIVDFTVIVSSYFFLQNVEYRFETLNDLWKCHTPDGLLSIPSECSQYDVAMMMDNIRTLHAELSYILRIFSQGYGQILLGFFVFIYIDILTHFYYSLFYKFSTSTSEDHYTLKIIIKKSIPIILNLQSIIFVLLIITAASRVNDKVKTIQLIFELLIIIINYNYLFTIYLI